MEDRRPGPPAPTNQDQEEDRQAVIWTWLAPRSSR